MRNSELYVRRKSRKDPITAMKTKTIKVYEYAELSDEAKKRALDEWNGHNNDMTFLPSMLNDECAQMLKEHDITGDPTCRYSLGHSQGDGLMFEGTFSWEGYTVKVKHQGHYYHSGSKSVETYRIMDGMQVEANEVDEKSFDDTYRSICKRLEKYGYEWIKQETSEAHFIDECNENEWVFTKDGSLFLESNA